MIKADVVKALRARTGAGMMECKKALVETAGDLEKAVDYMRKKGLASADKKASRIAAEGMIAMAADPHNAVLVEVNCETDFVAKGDDFSAFANNLAALALAENAADVEALSALSLAGVSVEDTRRALISKVGENITVRRMVRLSADKGMVGAYCHGGRMGVLVSLEGGDASLAKEIAMHIAAARPEAVDASGVDAEVVERERAIIREQAAQSGKPAEIVEKMIDGRMQKFFKECTLLSQSFVKNPDITVKEHLGTARVIQFVRLDLGEGIEKRVDDFASEVRAQAEAANA